MQEEIKDFDKEMAEDISNKNNAQLPKIPDNIKLEENKEEKKEEVKSGKKINKEDEEGEIILDK